MINKLSYLVMSLLFFNVLFIFFYYFKIVNFLYIDFIGNNTFFNILFTNLFILAVDVVYMFGYNIFIKKRFSYFLVVFIGALIGVFVSVFVLGLSKYELNDYLSIISYFIINVIFISYSLSFDQIKARVFE